MTDTTALRGEMTERLKEAGREKERLLEAAEAIAAIDSAEILGQRIWTRGIPAIDQIGVATIVGADFVGELVARLSSLRALGSIDVFPYGIPDPEVYEVTALLGNVAAGEGALP
jgi:hypothetical protein